MYRSKVIFALGLSLAVFALPSAAYASAEANVPESEDNAAIVQSLEAADGADSSLGSVQAYVEDEVCDIYQGASVVGNVSGSNSSTTETDSAETEVTEGASHSATGEVTVGASDSAASSTTTVATTESSLPLASEESVEQANGEDTLISVEGDGQSPEDIGTGSLVQGESSEFAAAAASADSADSADAAEASPVDKVADGAYIISTDWGMALDIQAGSVEDGATTQTYDNNYTAAQRFTINAAGQNDEGEWYYTITNVKSGKVIEEQWAQATPGTAVQQYSANGTAAQEWYLRATQVGNTTKYAIVNVNSGLALDVSGGSKDAGTQVWVYTANGSAAQLWDLLLCAEVVEEGAYTISSALDGSKVIDISGASGDSGAAVQLYDANGSLAQDFALDFDSATGYYEIKNYASGYVVDVTDGNAYAGAYMQQYEANDSFAQKWQLIEQADGTYTFISALSGLALDVPSATAVNGNQLWQYDANGSAAQRFALTQATPEISNGVFMIRVSAPGNLFADVKSGAKDDGTPIQLYAGNKSFAQKYVAEMQDDGNFALKSLLTGYYLAASADGGVVAQSAADTALPDNYLWAINATANGSFVIKNLAASLLGVNGAITDDSLVSAGASSTFSLWNFIASNYLEAGRYKITLSANAGLALDIDNNSQSNCTNIQFWNAWDTNGQVFDIYNLGSNRYAIIAAQSGLAVDVSEGATELGTNIWLYEQNGSDSQIWEAVWDGEGSFLFKSALGNVTLSATTTSDVSNAQLGVLNLGDANQKFSFESAELRIVDFAYRIAMLDSLSDTGLQVFGSTKGLSDGTVSWLWDAIRSYWNNGADVGFVMVDANTGAGVAYNIDKEFYSMSSIKGPYTASVAKEYSWSTSVYSDTMYNIVNVSSNEAYAYLRSAFGNGPMVDWVNWTHAWSVETNVNYTYYNARDFAKMWVGMYDYLTSNDTNSDWARSVFSSNNWIFSRQALNYRTTIYAKSGYGLYSWGQNHNEGYLVMDGETPYLVGIMSTANPFGSSPGLMMNLQRALDQAHSELFH